MSFANLEAVYVLESSGLDLFWIHKIATVLFFGLVTAISFLTAEISVCSIIHFYRQ